MSFVFYCLDECGICGGDNSQCQEIIGTYNTPAEISGYSSVVRIPKGSSNLNITQDAYPYLEDENYLGKYSYDNVINEIEEILSSFIISLNLREYMH